MNWLIAIIVCAIIGGIIAFANTGKKEDAIGGVLAGGVGCGWIIAQVALAVVSFLLVIKIFSWLFS